MGLTSSPAETAGATMSLYNRSCPVHDTLYPFLSHTGLVATPPDVAAQLDTCLPELTTVAKVRVAFVLDEAFL